MFNKRKRRMEIYKFYYIICKRKNDERLKNYLSKQYEYPQYVPDNTGKLSNLKDNGTFNFFDKISTFYDKYISLQESQTTDSNNKYKICTNKRLIMNILFIIIKNYHMMNIVNIIKSIFIYNKFMSFLENKRFKKNYLFLY